MSDYNDKLALFLDHFMALTNAEENSETENTFNKEFIALKAESLQYKEQNTFPAESGQLPCNKKKNRFKDILPFEYTRVQLHKTEGVEGSDYINANYIQGYDGNITYIAAQGPLPSTVNDFWRMLWYHQIEIVVMACKEVEMGKTKCSSYWPAVGESMYFGAIKVTTDHEENISNDFIIRQLTAECQGEQQMIRQFHYLAWPDHGRPTSATPIIRMIEMFREYRKRQDIPFVIHCSAGCGRTGTIIAIDYARSTLLSQDISDQFSVYSIVQLMRKQRPAMVQALDQYIFVYLAIVELVQKSLTNTPQIPSKALKFEKEIIPIATPPVNTDEAIYQNVEKNNQKLVTPPKPLARTSSGNNPTPPADKGGDKPIPPCKPSKPKLPLEVPAIVPRKASKSDEMPVPAPRKTSSSPVPGPTPTTEASYYSVPRSSTPTRPVVGNTSTLSTNNSKSILDTLIDEVGFEVLSNEDLQEVRSHQVELAHYSMLGDDDVNNGGDDVPPALPPVTKESTEFLSPDDSIYEPTEATNAPLVIVRNVSPVPGNSNNSSRPSSVTDVLPSVKPDTVNKASTKRRVPRDEAVVKSSSSPRRNLPPSNSGNLHKADLSLANNKYSFTGNYGFGVRVGKPKGPRPIPAHWNMLNGITY